MKNLTSLLFACLLFSFTSPGVESTSVIKPPGTGALRFSGANSTVALGGNLPIVGNFTLELWIKPADLAGARGILGSRNPIDCSFDLKLGDGRRVDADIGNGAAWLCTPPSVAFNYGADLWVHLAYVVTPTDYTVYANGDKIGTGSLPGSLPLLRDTNHRLFLGWSGFPNEYFKGDLSDIRIWNVARTAKQIANNFNRHLRSAQGLIAYYPCDEKRGTVLHDTTGNGNDGVLQGGTEWVSTSGAAEPITSG
ncbi:MAG TPA: LamG domain-containing protein, partial [Candidatus Paceibacterota bacterium]|nr:LamG domain-containing protein [Candidatus Paceibacterota bacterium]